MSTIIATSDGYVTDEPDIYSGLNAIVAGISEFGGPQLGTVNKAWLQFADVFGQGAPIEQAILTLYAHDFGNVAPDPFNTTPILFRAFDEDEAAVPTSLADFTARPKTTAQIVTSLPVTANNQSAQVDLTTVAQELAARAGWTGASFIVTIENDPTSTEFSSWKAREFSLALAATLELVVGLSIKSVASRLYQSRSAVHRLYQSGSKASKVYQ